MMMSFVRLLSSKTPSMPDCDGAAVLILAMVDTKYASLPPLFRADAGGMPALPALQA
jgi:hypothetical protein